MLGFGVVSIPRTLWRQANAAKSLRDLELSATKTKEKMIDSEAQIYELAREVALASRRVEPTNPLRPYVDLLLEKVSKKDSLLYRTMLISFFLVSPGSQ